jgi:hypothetical protein
MYPPAGIQEQILPGKSIRRRIAFAVGEGRAEDVDHFRAIVTTEAIPAELFELAPVPRDAPEPRGEESALERYLRRTSEGRTRKARPVSTGGWAVAGATVRVVRPGVETRGYAAHFDDAAAAGGAGPRLGATRRPPTASSSSRCPRSRPWC